MHNVTILLSHSKIKLTQPFLYQFQKNRWWQSCKCKMNQMMLLNKPCQMICNTVAAETMTTETLNRIPEKQLTQRAVKFTVNLAVKYFYWKTFCHKASCVSAVWTWIHDGGHSTYIKRFLKGHSFSTRKLTEFYDLLSDIMTAYHSTPWSQLSAEWLYSRFANC